MAKGKITTLRVMYDGKEYNALHYDRSGYAEYYLLEDKRSGGFMAKARHVDHPQLVFRKMKQGVYYAWAGTHECKVVPPQPLKDMYES